MLRDVEIVTTNWTFKLQVPDTFSLEEVLRSKRLSPSMFQAYVRKIDSVKATPLNTRVLDIPSKAEIVLRCIRNTDFRDILPIKTKVNRTEEPIISINERNISEKNSEEITHEINAHTAKKIVQEKILGFLKENNLGDIAIVGISGGGDSNTLAEAIKLFNTNNKNKKYKFFTIIFDPLWSKSAAERAIELCVKNNLEHEVYDEGKMEVLLNMKNGALRDMYIEYCDRFGKNSNHFFGTFLISLVARKLCEKNRAKEYILGFNREDILAELLFSIMNGQKPLAFPVRKFGEIRLLIPVYDVQKLMLDACYPKYSLSNYREREVDQSTPQRNMIYYLAHSIEDIYPNLGLSIMEGVKELFKNQWPEIKKEGQTDLYVSEYADKVRVKEIREFLGKFINP